MRVSRIATSFMEVSGKQTRLPANERQQFVLPSGTAYSRSGLLPVEMDPVLSRERGAIRKASPSVGCAKTAVRICYSSDPFETC